MVHYKDNKTLGISVVTTVRGDAEYRRNTKYLGHIEKKYYTINRDCFQVNNKWYTVDSGNILYDYEKKEYVHKYGARLVRGIVLDKDTQKLALGYFSANPYNNVRINSSLFPVNYAMSSDILEGNGWFEDLGQNVWMNSEEMSAGNVVSRKKIRNDKAFTDRGYNIEDNKDYEEKIELYKAYPTAITPKAKEMSKYLGDITFGAEIEVQRGCMPDNLRCRHGAVICRDGSLNGGAEIVTIPLSGAKGLQTLVNLADDLKHRTDIGLECSFHLHFGNIATDKLSVIALYRLARILQNELFTMFPYYKTDPAGVKQKNYTKKLLKLNINALKDKSREAYELYLQDSWKKLFDFYAEGKITLDRFNKRTREHPIHRKWEMKNRYHYFNFLNLFFGHRHTAEMRLSSGTTNSQKIINWLFICTAIIKYAQKYAKEIIYNDRMISLKEVLDIYPTLFPYDKKAQKVSTYLYKYFEQRRDRCMKDIDKNDRVSEWDIFEDKEYKFEWDGVCGLI